MAWEGSAELGAGKARMMLGVTNAPFKQQGRKGRVFGTHGVLELEESSTSLEAPPEDLSPKLFIGTLFCMVDLFVLLGHATCK